MIVRRRNHKSTLIAVFCVLVAGLIAMASCDNLTSSILLHQASSLSRAKYQPIGGTASLESDVHVKQDVGQRTEAGCGSVTILGPGGGGRLPSVAIAPSPSGIVYVGCDVGGVYTSTNDAESWVIKNKGLLNYDIRAIAVNLHNPSVVYVGTPGGVFKSTDGGESWLAKRNGFPPLDKWAISAPVSALAIDPANQDIVYAGIGRLAQCNSFEESHGKGTIYKSVDGGDSWSIVNTGPSAIDPSAVIHSIAIDPSNTSTLYTATDKGLYKSTDGGTSWTAKNNGLPLYPGETVPNIRRIVINPHNPDMLYVTVETKPNTEPWQGGVYKSTDGGESWIAKCNGLREYVGRPEDHPMQTSNYREIVIDPDNPETLYVGDFAWGDFGIYKTTDGGDNWVHTTIRTGPDKNMSLGWLELAGLPVDCLAIDPSDPNRLYFGTGMTLFKTNDGGDSWSQAYTKETESGKWQSIGLETTTMLDIAIDRTNPDNIYLGYGDIGFLKSEDGGASLERIEILNPWSENTYSIAIDPDSPNIIYAGHSKYTSPDNGGVVKSTDYGESWTVIGSPSNGLPDAIVNSIVIDPTTPVDSRTLYAGSLGYGVYKSIDGGQTWVSINNGMDVNRFVYRLVIDPNNPDTLYVGKRAISQSAGGYGGIYKTTDGGESWTKVNQNIELPDVYDLVIDPSDSSTLFAGTNQHYTQPSGPMHPGGVYKSVDGGENWQAVLTSDFTYNTLKIYALAISLVNPDLIFAGSVDYGYHDVCPGSGIFISRDGGETWEAMNEGLPLLCIKTLAGHPTNPDILYAGTHGHSLYRIVIPRSASLSGLTISPHEVEVGETVTVSVLVTNSGDIECTYQVQLMVDGSVKETSEVTLVGGASRTVNFTTTKDAPGLYTVTVGNLTGTFTVRAATEPPPPEEEEPTPEPPVVEEDEEEAPSESPATPEPDTSTSDDSTNWCLIGGIIGGAIVVVALLIYFLVFGRRST